MELNLEKIRIYGDLIATENKYNFSINNETIVELKNLARKLGLVNLKHIDCLQNIIFKYSQCTEILENEIPVLFSAGLSEKLGNAIKDLEYALKDVKSPFTYLMLRWD